jgi:hypothetical protein
MLPDHRSSTAIHEAGHATISCVLGEDFDFVELTGDREGLTMPFHSPCRICGSEVPNGLACPTCLRHYEKKNPRKDSLSRDINRGYRLEAAVAAAGELAKNGLVMAPYSPATTKSRRIEKECRLVRPSVICGAATHAAATRAAMRRVKHAPRLRRNSEEPSAISSAMRSFGPVCSP